LAGMLSAVVKVKIMLPAEVKGGGVYS